MITVDDMVELGFTLERMTTRNAVFTGHHLRVTLHFDIVGIYIIRVGQSCPLFQTDFYTKEQMAALLFALKRQD